ncbi:hypothetical protein GOP47_0031040 [Adiantum capillus-veneris]|nr:hypothetical protein GOP47_0031040 [Adiantum capillus-veneris]
MVDRIPVEMTQNLPLALDSPSCEKQCVEGLSCGMEVSSPGQNDRLVSLPNMATGDLLFGKHANSDVSLQQVLSDSIS